MQEFLQDSIRNVIKKILKILHFCNKW